MAVVIKPISLKEAITRWQAENPEEGKLSEVKYMKLNGIYPFIDKLDASIATLVNCERLALSTNMIDKIYVNGLKNLKILSLGRNLIKSLVGLEPVAGTLEELWISYNMIEKMKGINILKRLKVLYISYNQIKEWVEFMKFADLPDLENLNTTGNPLRERFDVAMWRLEVAKRLPKLQRLDNVPFDAVTILKKAAAAS